MNNVQETSRSTAKATSQVLSNGDTLLLSGERRPVLISAEQMSHIRDAHAQGGGVAGSRFYDVERLPEFVAILADTQEGYGLKSIDVKEEIGTDGILNTQDIERLSPQPLEALAQARVLAPAPETLADGRPNPRAGAMVVTGATADTVTRRRLAARPTTTVNAVFGSMPSGPDAFPGADQVLAAWEVARREAHLSDEQMAQARALITIFPGVPAPKRPNDPSLRIDQPGGMKRLREAVEFWRHHVFTDIPGPRKTRRSGQTKGRLMADDPVRALQDEHISRRARGEHPTALALEYESRSTFFTPEERVRLAHLDACLHVEGTLMEWYKYAVYIEDATLDDLQELKTIHTSSTHRDLLDTEILTRDAVRTKRSL